MNKKQKILDAADELARYRGLSDLKINEIARGARISDAEIYKYFRGKEEILFTLVFRHFTVFLAGIEERLADATDAWEELRRLIHYHLLYNDETPGYVRMIFECRATKNFYTSRAYELARRDALFFKDILRRGVESGQFRQDLEVTMLRDIILGSIDSIAISSVIIGEIESNVSEFDAVMLLIKPMLMKKNQTTPGKAERILAAAEQIFAAKGFAKATISDIARSANVSEGTVYEYFENKEDLLLSIPLKRFDYFVDEFAETIRVTGALKKLRTFINYHSSLFLTEPEFLQTFLLQIQLNANFYTSKAFKSFRSYFKIIEDIIAEGQLEGSIRPDVNAAVFRNMLLGAFSHVAIRWVFLRRGDRINQVREIGHMNDLLCSAVQS
ncbi:MAG TPA: TetR family transcriptional regulator [Deltaproteobacteria bacterium]|nr:TetR family transcriptional regulator [Deltaproteobacteria bacterium]